MENLNANQQEVLQQLLSLDLDKIAIEGQYRFGEDFQRVIVGMLLCDRFFTVQAEGLIKPDYFTNETHRLVVRLLFEYWYKYKTLPSRVFLTEELTQRLREKESAVCLIYLGELNNIYDFYTRGGVGDLVPGLDSREAILDKIVAFAKTQAIRGAFYQSFNEIKRNPESEEVWTKVDEYYRQARSVDRKIDIGLDYFQTLEERYARLAETGEHDEFFSLGFPEINNCLQGGGLKRGEIGAVMGLPGTGKSLCLVLASIENMLKGHKVLYITTEMDQDRVGTRFDSMLTNIGQHRLMNEKDLVWKALREHVSAYEDKRRLIIKQFPSGSADVSTIRAYHSQLHMYGFDPDLLIMDYVGDMKDFPGVPTWESRFRIVRDLRGFGVEESHCTLTALQPNRGAGDTKEADFLDESRQADSYGQNRVLDLFYTINQTETEQKAAVGRIFLAKVRNGKSRRHFKIGFDYREQTLRIWQISDDVYKMKMSEVKEMNSETVIDSVEGQIAGDYGTSNRRKGGKWKPSDESQE
jgi:hypothetical protein